MSKSKRLKRLQTQVNNALDHRTREMFYLENEMRLKIQSELKRIDRQAEDMNNDDC